MQREDSPLMREFADITRMIRGKGYGPIRRNRQLLELQLRTGHDPAYQRAISQALGERGIDPKAFYSRVNEIYRNK